jgi:hypothetical protein
MKRPTGIFDETGKEIYEGHIVTWCGVGGWIVKFRDGDFWYEDSSDKLIDYKNHLLIIEDENY